MNTPATGSLEDFIDLIKKNAKQTGAGLEQIARGGMLGLSDAGTSLARGVGSLVGSEGLQDFASEHAALARQFYAPQGSGGRAGAIIGRLLGEGALSLGAGGLIGKGIVKAAPKAAALLQGGNIAKQAAVNTLLSSPVDVALSAARANQSGQSIPKTVATDALANIAGGALLGGAAKGVKALADELRGPVTVIEDLLAPPPQIVPRTASFNITPEAALRNNVNEVAQQLLKKGITDADQIRAGLRDYGAVADVHQGTKDIAGQIADRAQTLYRRNVMKVAEAPFAGGKNVTYLLGDVPVSLQIKPAAGGRITVDVDDLPPEMQGKSFDTVGLRNLFKQVMADEDAKGIASFRSESGKIWVTDRPGVKQDIPNMTNADKKAFFKEMGLENADQSVKDLYLSEYMSGVYMTGEKPDVIKAELRELLKKNPVTATPNRPAMDSVVTALPRTAAQIANAQAAASRQRMFAELPMLNTSDEAMAAGVEATRRAQLPRELPPIPAVGPTTPKIRDFNKLPRLDDEGAAMQAARRTEAELLRNFLETPKSPNLLAARIDPEGVAEYIAKTRRLSQFDADRVRRSAELEDAMIAGAEGQTITPEVRDAARQQVEFERAQAEAVEAARKVGKVYDPYAPEPTVMLSGNSFDQMSPQQRYDFLQMLRRNAQGMDAMSGYGRPITSEVSPNTLRQSVRDIRREASKAAFFMELPSTFNSFQQLQPPTDVGEIANMTPGQIERFLRDLVKAEGGTFNRVKKPKKSK
jgi:hypothetical protein